MKDSEKEISLDKLKRNYQSISTNVVLMIGVLDESDPESCNILEEVTCVCKETKTKVLLQENNEINENHADPNPECELVTR